MAGLFKAKNLISTGVIIAQSYDQFLSFDQYLNHYLMPYSPSYRNIDFAVSSLLTIGVENIIVFTEANKEFIGSYLMHEYPETKFYVFDDVDIKHEFFTFFEEINAQLKIQRLIVMHGDYPVWFDMNQMVVQMGRDKILSIQTIWENQTLFPAMILDDKTFIKRLQIAVDSALATGQRIDLKVPDMVRDFRPKYISVFGYFMPLLSIRHFYERHIDMLDDYHFLDHFNSLVPLKGDRAKTNNAVLQRNSHIINSIVGEDCEVNGKVINSVICAGVKVDDSTEIVNSIIFPGNHIGRKCNIYNTIIDEFSGDNTLPNIEKNVNIGKKTKSLTVNKLYPKKLNFGVTLIGKDVFVPSNTEIGANCYIESFISSSKVRAHRQLNDGESLTAKD